jgi:hypothetical protein
MLDARRPRPADWLWLGAITVHGAAACFLLILGIGSATALSGQFRELFLAWAQTGSAAAPLRRRVQQAPGRRLFGAAPEAGAAAVARP